VCNLGWKGATCNRRAIVALERWVVQLLAGCYRGLHDTGWLLRWNAPVPQIVAEGAERVSGLQYQDALEKKLDKAFESCQEIPHSCALLSATDSQALGALRPHEELRDCGLLVHHDKLSWLARSPGRIMFFSQCGGTNQTRSITYSIGPGVLR
jgi:hypothetical protein